MGKGTIISGGTGGLYQVQLVLHRERVTARLAALLSQIEALSASADEMEDGKEKTLALLKVAAMQREHDYLTATMPDDPIVTAYCADRTEDLSGTVATVEVPGCGIQSVLLQRLYALEQKIIWMQDAIEEEIVGDEPAEDPQKMDGPTSDPDGPAEDPQEPASDPEDVSRQRRDPVEVAPVDESEEEPLTGDASVAGLVRSDAMANLENISVKIYRKEGSGDDVTFSYVSSESTDENGQFTIAGLAAGTYRVKFEDSAGAYLSEYYNNKATLDLANDIEVTAAGTITGINASLGTAATVSGTVTSDA